MGHNLDRWIVVPAGERPIPARNNAAPEVDGPGQAGHAKTHLLDNAFETSKASVAGLDGLVEAG
jgi:hypothetical protein